MTSLVSRVGVGFLQRCAWSVGCNAAAQGTMSSFRRGHTTAKKASKASIARTQRMREANSKLFDSFAGTMHVVATVRVACAVCCPADPPVLIVCGCSDAEDTDTMFVGAYAVSCMCARVCVTAFVCSCVRSWCWCSKRLAFTRVCFTHVSTRMPHNTVCHRGPRLAVRIAGRRPGIGRPRASDVLEVPRRNAGDAYARGIRVRDDRRRVGVDCCLQCQHHAVGAPHRCELLLWRSLYVPAAHLSQS